MASGFNAVLCFEIASLFKFSFKLLHCISLGTIKLNASLHFKFEVSSRSFGHVNSLTSSVIIGQFSSPSQECTMPLYKLGS